MGSSCRYGALRTRRLKHWLCEWRSAICHPPRAALVSHFENGSQWIVKVAFAVSCLLANHSRTTIVETPDVANLTLLLSLQP